LLIATLIAAGRLDDRLLHAALSRVPGATFSAWVDQGDAADLIVPDSVSGRVALQGWEDCDVIVQPAATRSKRMLVADMDSTIIGQECIDELADYAGVKPQVAAITERAMRGELDFADALRERVALLDNLPAATIRQCLAERIRPNPGAETLVRTLQRYGAHTILVSGGFTDFVAPIADVVGFDDYRANVLAREGDRLTGKVEGMIVDSATKKAVLMVERDARNLAPAAVMALGDGANDLPMIEEAGLGVAYRAKPVLASAADARLDHHDLSALLWALGIPKVRWVS
jgi:phosphoserine phosphatase